MSSRKRQVPAPAPAPLTDAEREALFYRPRELNVSRDTKALEGIVERILAARLADQREQIAVEVREFALDVPCYGSRGETRMVDVSVEGLRVHPADPRCPGCIEQGARA